MEKRDHHASLAQAKRNLKKEKILWPNDAWKRCLKTWDWWNYQSFQAISPEPHKEGLQCPIRISSCNGHKTQSFMKNGGQQKFLDKALLFTKLPPVWQMSKISMEASDFLCKISWSTWSYGILDFFSSLCILLVLDVSSVVSRHSAISQEAFKL